MVVSVVGKKVVEVVTEHLIADIQKRDGKICGMTNS